MHSKYFSLTRWFIFLMLVGCGSSPEPRNCLRIAFNARPATLDPAKAGDFASSTLICMLYEGLTRCLPGGEVELALADWIEMSQDQTVYTFHLRKAYWSDGELITAHDFERSWKKVLSPPQLCAQLFYPIKNAENCVRGNCSVDAVGIRALSDELLQVELEHPTPYFYSLTAFPTFLPARKNFYSGPFCLQMNDSEILLVKNNRFWNAEAISLDEVRIHMIADEMTALQMFERGELDFIGGPLSPLPLDAIDTLRKQLAFLPNAATTFCAFNTESFPFNNLHLRKSFSAAIDRQEIVDLVTQTGQVPASSFLPPQLTSIRGESLSNPNLARKHLEKALEELNLTKENLNGLTLYYRTGQLEKRLAQTLQRQWEETLGIQVSLVQTDPKSHAERLQTRKYQLCLTSWIAQFDDPLSILDRFKDKTILKNYSGWENLQYQRLLDLATRSSNRDELLKEAEKLFSEEVPIAPIYHWRSPTLIGKRLEATGTTPSGGILFERFRLQT